ncbi:MAG: anti sigma factor C-terminal domain-containing protein [Romboutsia sp.]
MKKDKDIERELDNLFDFENSIEGDIIKNAKKKSYMKITFISLGMTILVLVLGIITKLQMTPYIVSKEIISYDIYHSIVGANTFLGIWEEESKLLSSGALAPKYKLIDGKPVYVGEIDIENSNYPYNIRTNSNELYSYFGNRIMEFYHPLVGFDKYPNDLFKIDSIDQNKNIEMAISFDRQYSLEEVKNILPKEIDINWMWVDTFKGDRIRGLKPYKSDIAYTEAQTVEENYAVGFSTIEKDGELKKDPVDTFVETIELGLKRGGKYKRDIKDIHEALVGKNNKIDKNNIKVVGAVVVGNKADLEKLKDMKTIKASSLGVINEKY